jgi:hypothetical protein
MDLGLLPYPQQLDMTGGTCRLGRPQAVTDGPLSETELLALKGVERHFPESDGKVELRLTEDQIAFLENPDTSPEAYCAAVTPTGITVVGRSRWGMLYGTQTLNQLAVRAGRDDHDAIPCMTVRDWPDMQWRCLSPQLTWYAGWNRLEGYDCGNWHEGEWKWLVDWSLMHKCNAWAVCMYGYWPFTLPGYEQETLDLDSFRFNPETGQKEPWRFTHPNIETGFFPEVIRYANARGIRVYAYIGKNSFNGADFRNDPERYAGGAAELLPFAPGVEDYWDAFLGRILEMGFNGFVLEDPETYHVPNRNRQCYETFWEPWAETYGFSSVKETDPHQPPLGVHVEYYTWLFRRFDEMIQRHGQRLHHALPVPVFLISHILANRIIDEVGDRQERKEWFELMDRRHGRRVPFVCHESNEREYVELLGADRVASLGGRGGSCTNAMRRIPSINNNWLRGPMGGDIVHDVLAQRRIHEAGGMGAMGYVFEWTNTEVFAYVAAQYLWRSAGVPGIDATSQVEFLRYAYRLYYGDGVGALVARVMDEGSCVNDAMVLEDVHGSQWPTTGRVLHRDYQYLSVLADRVEPLAREASTRWTGHAPALDQPVYDPRAFHWDGFDRQADARFKAERLRLLWVATRRSQEMCRTALAHGKTERLMAEGASVDQVSNQFDIALAHARENERIYQINYLDDYDWTDGLCSYVTAQLEEQRQEYTGRVKVDGTPLPSDRPVPEVVRSVAQSPLFIPWEPQTDVVPEPESTGKPGLYLCTALGLTARDDYFRLGVVFSVESEDQDGRRALLFRRSLGRRHTGWEHWTVPLAEALDAADGGKIRLRLVTDAYTRSQDRNAPTWEWPLWGQPQIVRVMPDGTRQVLRDLVADLDQATALVRLDRDGQERPFDGGQNDATGATFRVVTPSTVVTGLRALRTGPYIDLQWVSGFADWSGAPPHRSAYRCYLGSVDSGWTYAHETGRVSWRTAVVPVRQRTAVAFIGGTDYVPGTASLHVNGRHVLDFETGMDQNAVWETGAAKLHYLHGDDTRDRQTTYGLSGLFVLVLPGEAVTPGRPCQIEVEMCRDGGGWFMIHGYGDPISTAGQGLVPEPRLPAIAAYTPHLGEDGAGVTIGVYEVERE